MSDRSPKNKFSLNPLLWLACCFALGIVLGNFSAIPSSPSVIAAFGTAVLSILLRNYRSATLLVLISFFATGCSFIVLEQGGVSDDRVRTLFETGRLVSGEPAEIEGMLSGAAEPAPDGYFLLVRTQRASVGGAEEHVSGRVRIFVPLQTVEAKADFANLDLSHGSRVKVACLLEREEKYLNPGVYSRTVLLDRQGIDATANLKSPLLIEKMADAMPIDRLAGTFFELRAGLIHKTREMFSPRTAGVLIASMLGNKYFLDKQTSDVFREGGTFHVLVISGLHITFIGGLLLLFTRIFTKRRRVQAVVTVSSLWLYGIAVGGDVPVVRACVMFTIVMIGYAEFRSSTLLNSLGASALFLLAWRPSDLFDPSFQLTIVSVGAIVAVGLPLLSKLKSAGSWMPTPEQPFPPNASNWLRRFCETVYWNEDSWEIHRGRQIWKAKIAKSPYFSEFGRTGLRNAIIFIFESVVVSAVVQICLMPLLVYYFHRFPLVSIPMNMWVGGVLAAESVAAVIAVTISTVSATLAFPFVALAEFFNWMIVTLPSIATRSIFSNTRFPIYSGPLRAMYLIYFAPLVASTVFLIRWDPFALKTKTLSASTRLMRASSPITLAVAAVLILLHPFSSPRPDGKLRIDFLDVGQGDAALITFPNGKTMLIDAGGKLDYRNADTDQEQFEPDVPRIGEMVVSEFLWERGISHIDMIVATHADADHIQGLSDIVRNFSVGNAYLGRIDDDPELAPFLAELDRFGIKRTIVRAGETMEIAGVRIDVLNPLDDGVSANNGSVVFKITFAETSFLFTGDIEAQAEAMMLLAGDDLKADVVKVPHHGSRSSSTAEFVGAVKPRYAIVSVGRRSLFGHPHTEVAERWRAGGAELMTTGERGTITVVSDGKEISVSRFVAQPK